MWRKLQIDDRDQHMQCIYDDETVRCLLYDGQTLWCEIENEEEILKRVKLLNKRISYDKHTVRQTLGDGTPEQVIGFSEASGGDEEAVKLLHLKYKVHLLPFIIKWHLRQSTETEYRKYVVEPLFMVIRDLQEQNRLLRDAVLKKDAEIAEYKFEGATLKRATLATKPFDLESFDQKYGRSNQMAISLLDMAPNGLLEKEQLSVAPQIAEKIEKQENGEKLIGTPTSKSATNAQSPRKISPRNRKRKVIEQQQLHMQRRLRARKEKLNYLSSQSQNTENSVSEDEPKLVRSPATTTNLNDTLKTQADERQSPSHQPKQEQTPYSSPVTSRRMVNDTVGSPLCLKLEYGDVATPKTSPSNSSNQSSALAGGAESSPAVDVREIMERLQELERKSMEDLARRRSAAAISDS